MALFLGIDGGGTKTTCVVGDEVRVLGTATDGGSNIVRLGEDAARRNLHMAIRETCAAAGIAPAQIAGACIGAAGVSATTVPEQLKAILAELVPGKVRVVGDMEIALEAAFGDGPGVIVIAGTGSIALGRDRQGKTARVGGWGYAISDEGSGHWIGRELVRRALHTWDVAGESDLPRAVRGAWNVETAEEVVRIANATPPRNFAELFPLVLKCANQGDKDARAILEHAAAELAKLAQEAIARLWGEGARRVPVAMGGSILRESEIVRETFIRLLRAREMACVSGAAVDPVMGALALARKALLTA